MEKVLVDFVTLVMDYGSRQSGGISGTGGLEPRQIIIVILTNCCSSYTLQYKKC